MTSFIDTHVADLGTATSPRAPMPLHAPPVGPARARRWRLAQLRERMLAGDPVDIDAVAGALVRRARFDRELAAGLAAQTRR